MYWLIAYVSGVVNLMAHTSLMYGLGAEDERKIILRKWEEWPVPFLEVLAWPVLLPLLWVPVAVGTFIRDRRAKPKLPADSVVNE